MGTQVRPGVEDGPVNAQAADAELGESNRRPMYADNRATGRRSDLLSDSPVEDGRVATDAVDDRPTVEFSDQGPNAIELDGDGNITGRIPAPASMPGDGPAPGDGPGMDTKKARAEVNASMAALDAAEADVRADLSAAEAAESKARLCQAIPSARLVGLSGAVGAVTSGVGGGELLLNYKSGDMDGFGFGGVQVGLNGAVSVQAYGGLAWGVNEDSSNYGGSFSGLTLSPGPVGVFAASSSQAFADDGIEGVIPNLLRSIQTTDNVKVVGGSVGWSFIGKVGGGAVVTDYSAPRPLGSAKSQFNVMDWTLYGLNQWCK